MTGQGTVVGCDRAAEQGMIELPAVAEHAGVEDGANCGPALDQTARFTRQARFNLWARELAKTAHDAFAYGSPGDRHLFWKMSTDLDRALVPSVLRHLEVPESAVSVVPNAVDLEEVDRLTGGVDVRAGG